MSKLEAVKKDFRNFLAVTWDFLRLPSPTPVQYDIAHWIQTGPKRRGVEAFRGVGKSYITSAYVVWRLLNNPQLKIMVVSAGSVLANDISVFIKQIIYGLEITKHLRPRDGQRSSNIKFDVAPASESKDPSVTSKGITGQITGTRADIVIADDVETPNTSFTIEAQEKLAYAVAEFDAILKPEGGEIIYLGTPQTQESLYNKLIERGYTFRIWPAKIPTQDQVEGYGLNSDGSPKLAPYVRERWRPEHIGNPLDPQRFSATDLEERLMSYGLSGFNLQFMLDTSLSDALKYPLKLSDLIVDAVDNDVAYEKILYAKGPEQDWKTEIPMVGFAKDRFYRALDHVGEPVPYKGRVMHIDPSGRGSDETGYAVAFMLNGYIHVPCCGGLIGGYEPATLQHLANIAKKYKVNHITIEDNFGDGMFTQLLKPYLQRTYPCFVEDVKSMRQKELRVIDTLEPVMNSHRLIIDPEVFKKDYESVQQYSLESQKSYMLGYQLSHITKEKGCLRHDDRVEALSAAVGYWVQAMAQDEDRKIEERKEDKRQEQLEYFMKHAVGWEPDYSGSWIAKRA